MTARGIVNGWRSISLTWVAVLVTPALAENSPPAIVVGTLIWRTAGGFIGGATPLTARTRSMPSTEPVRWIVHKTQVVDGQGEPGEVIEAAGDRLVVAAGVGAVALLTIQLAGKKPFTAAEFLRGHRIQPGDRLGL